MQQCEWAIERGIDLIGKALREGMFKDVDKSEEKVRGIAAKLSDLSDNKTHSRHFHYNDCIEMGLKVELLEAEGKKEPCLSG